MAVTVPELPFTGQILKDTMDAFEVDKPARDEFVSPPLASIGAVVRGGGTEGALRYLASSRVRLAGEPSALSTTTGAIRLPELEDSARWVHSLAPTGDCTIDAVTYDRIPAGTWTEIHWEANATHTLSFAAGLWTVKGRAAQIVGEAGEIYRVVLEKRGARLFFDFSEPYEELV